MLVKCRICGNKIDRDTAYKVRNKNVNEYYCNQDEYLEKLEKIKIKDNTYEKIFNIFGRKVTNTTLFKEISELESVYGYENIYQYLCENEKYLSNVLSKDFKSEYAQIRYFSTILKNNLADFKVESKQPEKKIEIDMPTVKYAQRKKRKSLLEIEQEVGEEL
jgi:ribosomal protein L16 Arg81 hydroxylase